VLAYRTHALEAVLGEEQIAAEGRSNEHWQQNSENGRPSRILDVLLSFVGQEWGAKSGYLSPADGRFRSWSRARPLITRGRR